MGDVYLAEDTRLGRQVALKRLSERRMVEPAAKRLIREARAAAALNHPNIGAVYDVLEAEGTTWIVMEYVPGETLADRLGRGPLGLAAALRAGEQLCEALAEAHSHGILHRDVKPANLVLAANGRLKVLDFGLATWLSPDPHSDSVSGSLDAAPGETKLVGTPSYIPPERFEGRSSGEREDVYAVGVVLYELLTGRRPYAGATLPDLAAAILDGQAPPLRTLSPAVPEAVAGLVAQAMARDPAARPASAAELGAALRRLGPDTAALTLSQPALRVGRSRRGRLRGGLLSAAGFLVLLLAGGLWLRPRGPEPPGVPVVLVLPLANATGDASADALGAGLADVLISALVRVPGVNVLSLSAGQTCARDRRDPACPTREFGADYVLDGTVQRDARRLRVTLSLVRGTTSVVAWSESFDGVLDDLFGLQHRVAEGVAAALRLRVPRDETGSARALAMSERVFSDYAEALRLLERRDQRASLDQAIRLLVAVTSAEPGFVLGWAGLGRAYWTRFEETRSPPDGERAEVALDEALRLDPDAPGVLITRAMVLKGKGQLQEAEAAARRAAGVLPESDEAHAALGVILAAEGRVDEGIAELRRAIALRPGYWRHHDALALAEYRRGRLEEAAESFRRVVELRPDSAWGHVNLGSALYAMGERAAARREFERAIAIEPDADALSNLGFLAFEERRYADAALAFEQAVALLPEDAGLHRNLGDAYAKLGRTEAAGSAYAKAVRLQQALLRARPDDARTIARLAVYEAKVADHEEARRLAERASALSRESPDVAYLCAVALALAGDLEPALEALGRAVRLGYSLEIVLADEDLARLRPLPRFRELTSGTRGVPVEEKEVS